MHDGLCSVAPEEVLPVLLAPFQPDTSFLHTLVEDIRVVTQHNFFPSLLMAGGSVLALHYSTILQSGGCPIVVAQGCSETGKSTALRVGLSLFGMFWTKYIHSLHTSTLRMMVLVHISVYVCTCAYWEGLVSAVTLYITFHSHILQVCSLPWHVNCPAG